MSTVDYLPFAAAGGSNVESQGSYAGSTHQLTGFVTGVALSPQLNKVWRQASVMASAMANYIADLTGLNVLDDGNVAALTVKIAMTMLLSEYGGTSGGSANVQTLTPAVAPTAYQAGQHFRFIAGFTNTGPATLNVSTLGAVAIDKITPSGPAALVGGEIVTGNEVEVMYDGTRFLLTSIPIPVVVNPTITLKKGTNAGDYTTTSGSFVAVDGTNLSYTVVIPVGWKLKIEAAGTIDAPAIGSSVTTDVAIFDGASLLNGSTMQDSNGTPSQTPFAFAWVINGDGASHTITLQFKQDGGSASAAIIINTGGYVPSMVFTLTPSN
ncbi:MAG TPA: hypothetical protein VND65_18270 [Candidatus Binatia bacterium]|nr:hypothetical protein [Candidatus Binatia bacterium]